jgi:hypothetical protein
MQSVLALSIAKTENQDSSNVVFRATSFETSIAIALLLITG